MLVERGRIAVEPSVGQWRLRALGLGVQEIPLTGDIAIAAVGLTGLHADPADRIIIATAVTTDATLVTADGRILGWRGTLKRHDARR